MKRIIFFIVLFLGVSQARAQQSKVLVDNEKLKVTEYLSEPGKDVCGMGKHSHGEHLTILPGDANVKTTNADGSIQTENYSAEKHSLTIIKNGVTQQITTDGTFWIPADTHTVINTGNKTLKCYIIETKH
ncbi:MAG: hypothetical protein H7Y86_08545 [Rhizobacter sp.]|nr:hypothetical protein [Ferruginibacter sp.]